MKSMVQTHVVEEQLTIWRAMEVSSSWREHVQKEGHHLGVYWTCDARCARPLECGPQPNDLTAILESSVHVQCVDWESTFKQLLDPKLGWQEKEIRLIKGAPVEINVLYIEDEAIDEPFDTTLVA
jgi:hypothetical protein